MATKLAHLITQIKRKLFNSQHIFMIKGNQS